jgi:hypothetical protein
MFGLVGWSDAREINIWSIIFIKVREAVCIKSVITHFQAILMIDGEGHKNYPIQNCLYLMNWM